MKTKLLIYIFLALLLSSCGAIIPLSSTYFDSTSKVGVLINVNDISVTRSGGQGLLDIALTQGIKYKEPLKTVDKELDIERKIKDLYTNIFTSKGKDLLLIKDSINFKTLQKFNIQNNSKKKFYKYDLRGLKSKYNIDELLIINVRYGILVSYYSVIETGRSGNCMINSEIVNLNNNSILYKGLTNSAEKITGKWKTPPKYEKLLNAINNAIKNSMNTEKTKLR